MKTVATHHIIKKKLYFCILYDRLSPSTHKSPFLGDSETQNHKWLITIQYK